MHGRRAPPARTGRPTPWYACEDRSAGVSKSAPCAHPLPQRAVLADEEVEVRTLLVGEFQEDPLAFGILEPLTVPLEELVRPALALDTDEQRLPVVDAFPELLGTRSEQPVGGALEEQERGARLELRVLSQQLAVPLLERAQMLPLLRGELLEDRAAARVARHAGRARIELQAAALGGDRDAQRVPRKDQLGCRAVDRRSLPACPAFLAGPDDLDDRLSGREAARRRNLLDQRFDVGAEEFGRTAACAADQMEMAWMAERRLEARAALTEVHLACDPGPHHPLQRAIDGGAADAWILAADEIAQVVGAQVAFLAHERAENPIAFTRALAA